MLLEQHRMNTVLCSFIGQVFYGVQLQASNELREYAVDVQDSQARLDASTGKSQAL